jgi:hypothetical protein
MRIRRCCSLLMLAGGLGGNPLSAQDTNLVSAVSASRSFVIQSHSRERNIELGIWAEEVQGRITSFMGRPVPLGRGQPVYIQLQEDPTKEPLAIPRQHIKNSYLTQQLLIVNFDEADQEDMLEALCQLLLSRYAMAAQPPSIRTERPAQVPSWFAVGIAQNMYPVLRERNRRLCVRWLKENRLEEIPDLMNQQFLPRGRMRVKVMCGLLVSWLQEAEQQDLVSAMPSAWARGETVDATWLSKHLLNDPVLDEKLLAKQWRLWITRVRQAQSEFGGDIYGAVDQLKARLNLQPKLLGVGYPVDGPDTISLRALPDSYESPWFGPLISKLSIRVMMPGLRQAQDFQEIVTKYQAYFQTMASLPALHAKGKTSQIQSVIRASEKQLNEANLALAEYDEKISKWRAYMDVVERKGKPNQAKPTRTAFQAFVDQAEAKRKANPPPTP